MSATRLESAQPARQPGFALIAAIFLLVVLSALGGFMLTMSTGQQAASTDDVLAANAMQAARAGLEWGAYQVLQNAGTCTASNSLAFGGSLAGLQVIVNCVKSGPYDEAGNSVSVYQLTSTASSGTTGHSMAVERQLQATIAN